MNEESKKLTAAQRKAIVLPRLKEELETLPSEGIFGSNSEAKRELMAWIKDLEAIRPKTEEVRYFMSEDFNKWKYSALCDYLP